ncbi:MAG: hypothetical protein JSS72_09600 [Armatimonadetes bacterium]|nr:hypothetical protein [Armatimonadota bacterium]
MSPLAIVSLVIALSDASGSYQGHFKTDRALLVPRAKTPEHKKLLIYTLGRIEHSILKLTLKQDGTFTRSFDDGFNGDKVTHEGQWKVTGNKLVLTIERANTRQLAKPISEAIAYPKMTGRFMGMPNGITVTYTRLP